MKCGCIGEKLGHSFSKVIHEKLGLYEYELWPLEKKALSDFMTRCEFDGINVTIPYKKDVIPYLKEMSEEARLCGAVNTVVNRAGELFGFNTDFLGMRAMLEKGGIELCGKNVLILGTGGTSSTALKLAESLGAKRVERVSRSGKNGALTYEEALQRKDTEILLNTTPCGMFPNMGTSPVDLDQFPQLSGVADAVYNPLKSQLVLDAETRGIPAVGGLYMLVSQGVFAAQIFTGREDLSDRIEPIFTQIEKEKQNLVLIGMPGCGKSTLGKELASRLGKEFTDSDEEIVRLAGKPISEIFRTDGEEAFRDLESEVIRSLSERQGAVIATGGGAVLRKRNVEYLKGNGILLFLDAPPETLLSTPARPLSSNQEALMQRYRERYHLYCAASDRHIPVSRSVEDNLLAIQKELL